MIEYYVYKDFISSLGKMKQAGGSASKKAERAHSIHSRAITGDDRPFHGISVTKNGESRIKNCIKYDLGDGYRLITIQTDRFCAFCFAGSHHQADKWLERNSGLVITKDKRNQLNITYQSESLSESVSRTSSQPDYAEKKLLDRLDTLELDEFVVHLPPVIIPTLMRIESTASDNQIIDSLGRIENKTTANFAYDVLVALRAGDKAGAINRIDLYKGASKPLEALPYEELVEVQDGMTIKKLSIGSKEYSDWIGKYIVSAGYQDWMLFMHPEQQKIVDASLEGPTKLSGVSGSGKTCIVVNRAIALAKKKPLLPVLILTLNKSLAALIQELVDHACPDDSIKERIECTSFFELCQKYLFGLEPENRRLYVDVTWKMNEHIDEIWEEFYLCECNNKDAEILLPIHKSLNSQSIAPDEYIRQEFDWIRSAFTHSLRNDYIKIERKGRAIPFLAQTRKTILSGLQTWEDKMRSIGVIDHIGLASNLLRHLDEIVPAYSSILVDEVQDFGTIELMIIRKLVSPSKNDIFLTGDMAQHILPKHQSFKEAGLDIPGARSLSIKRNYRNSREILKAAYELFFSTIESDIVAEGEMDILDPEYANFSTPKPSILKANNLTEEIAYAITYATERLDQNKTQKVCIAICGFTLFEISKFSHSHNLQTLDGTRGLINNGLFISDLDNMKGYEFDLVCILNCKQGVLPNHEMPREEQFRDSCRFYVAMTRAKYELIISHSDCISDWFNNNKCLQYFLQDEWSNCLAINPGNLISVPKKLYQESNNKPHPSLHLMTGQEFIYSKYALGVSQELQDKLEALVDGTSVLRGRNAVKWKNIGQAYKDIINHPHAKLLFGEKTWREFAELYKSIIAN